MHTHHSCQCEHTNIKYCKGCKVAYCVDCREEWGRTPYYSWTNYPYTYTSGNLKSYTHSIEPDTTSVTFANSAPTTQALQSFLNGTETKCGHND